MGAAAGLRPAPLLAGVAAAGVLVATVMTGPDAGADVRTGRISVGYSCLLPTGAQELTATLVQDYPAAAAAGSRVQPGSLTVETTVPRGLLPAGTAELTGSASLEVAVTDGAPAAPATGSPATAAGSATPTESAGSAGTVAAPASGTATVTLRTSAAAAAAQTPAEAAAAAAATAPAGATLALWPGLTVAPLRLGTADPALTVTGPVPALTAGRAGSALVVTPMALSLSLRAGGRTVQLDCTRSTAPLPLGSVSTVSATHPDAGASAAPAPSAATRRQAALRTAHTPSCLATPTGQLNPSYLPTPPPGSTAYPPIGQPPADTGVECAYAVGYANVGKLGEASLVNNPDDDPGLATLAVIRDYYNFSGGTAYLQADEIGNLTLPPADATFLTYGFMPTTAKMQLVPNGPLTVVNTGAGPFYNQQSITTINGQQSMRLYDVKVDGTPLDVGSDCRTVTPLQLKLVGISNDGLPGDDPSRDYSIQTGGPLTQNQLTIPYFTGCGANGQDLDPLFDAAVSGTGNSLNLVQGPICTTFQGTVCDTFTMPELPVRAPTTKGQ